MIHDVRLIRGDCLKAMPRLADGSADAVITDPPYLTHSADRPVFIRTKGNGSASQTVGMPWGYSLDWIDAVARLRPRHWIAFSNYASIGDLHTAISRHAKVMCVFTWRKPNAPRMARPVPRLDCEFILWARRADVSCARMGLFSSMVIDAPFPSAGVTASERVLKWKNGPAAHPCQKPLSVMRLFLERMTDVGQTILDPYMGSGTTGVAAIQLGRKFIGIEQSPEYFTIAKNRLAAARRKAVPA